MRGLTLIAVGLVLIAVDFRTTALDLLPDVIGWLLVVIGAIGIRQVAAAWLAGIAGILSCADVFLPYVYDPIDPATGELLDTCRRSQSGATSGCNLVLRYESVGTARAVAIALAAVAGAGAFVLLLRFVVARARALQTREAPALLGLRFLSVVMPVLWAGSYVAVVAVTVDGDGYEPFWTGDLAMLSGTLLVLQLLTALLVGWFSSRLGRFPEGDPSGLPSWSGVVFGESEAERADRKHS